MTNWCHGMYGLWGHWPGGILMMIFWLLIFVGFAVLARGFFSRSGDGLPASAESAEAILKRRYAKGEIDKTEFEEKRKGVL